MTCSFRFHDELPWISAWNFPTDSHPLGCTPPTGDASCARHRYSQPPPHLFASPVCYPISIPEYYILRHVIISSFDWWKAFANATQTGKKHEHHDLETERQGDIDLPAKPLSQNSSDITNNTVAYYFYCTLKPSLCPPFSLRPETPTTNRIRQRSRHCIRYRQLITSDPPRAFKSDRLAWSSNVCKWQTTTSCLPSW